MRNHSYENDFDLHENETACRTHFHIKSFALRLVLKQRHKRTRKWSIENRSIPLPDVDQKSIDIYYWHSIFRLPFILQLPIRTVRRQLQLVAAKTKLAKI